MMDEIQCPRLCLPKLKKNEKSLINDAYVCIQCVLCSSSGASSVPRVRHGDSGPGRETVAEVLPGESELRSAKLIA